MNRKRFLEDLKKPGLDGVTFRPVTYEPAFDKYKREPCLGFQIHITDKRQVKTIIECGLALLQALGLTHPERFRWLDFASRARGNGAEVIITEVDPTKALEAVMDGFRVMSMPEAAKIGDVFCTVTGNKSVLTKEHFALMKDGAIISNSGHFNVEIDIPALENMSSSKRTTRTFVDEYSLKDGRKINLLGEGRLINLAAAEGHPASVMDMSFADQALSVEYMVKNFKTLDKKVYRVPDELDKRVAKLKLESMGIKIDRLTPEQEEYLAGWSEGT